MQNIFKCRSAYLLYSVNIEDVEGFRKMSCCSSNLTNSFVIFACVLCCKVPSPKSEINYVSEVVKTELKSVLVTFTSAQKGICKSCLALVKKRKGVREKLQQLGATIKAVRGAPSSDSNERPAVAKKTRLRSRRDKQHVSIATRVYNIW